MSKKQLLFVINNLNCGGAEKALISLLETINYSSYDVDLFLFKHEGLFFNKIPNEVTLLKEPKEYKFFDMSFKKAIKDSISIGRIDIALGRIASGYIFQTEKNRARCDQRVWKYLSRSIGKLNKKYDVAIGYLEKNPIYFCLDKVNAEKKIGFIHNDYEKLGLDANLDKEHFNNLNFIVTVSNECASVLSKKFPNLKEKIKVVHNIVSPKIIHNLSRGNANLISGRINIVSVGRLDKQKGFDMAIQACQKLIADGYKVNWYVIGDGEEKSNLKKLIKEHNLEENFLLLGLKENPYPYIKEADIYVQPSRFEGKSIAIDEAKILHKPIVVTNFSTAKDQIKNNENGFIVDMNSESLFVGIKKIIDNQKYKEKLVKNLSKESLGTESEIQKIYELCE